MPLVLDTYNVLQTVGVLPPELAGIDVRGLIDLLRRSRYRTEPAHLICDGHPPSEGAPPRRVGKIGVSYAGNQTADDLIDKFIRNASHPKQLIVVSSDHEVLRSARRRRCRILRSDEFLHHLVNDVQRPQKTAPRPKPPPPVSDQQVERWKSLFGMDDEQTQRAVEDEARVPEHLRRRRSSHVVIRSSPDLQGPEANQAADAPADHADKAADKDPDDDMSVFPNEVVKEAEQIAHRLRQDRKSSHESSDHDDPNNQAPKQSNPSNHD